MDEIRIMCQTPIRLFYAFNNTHIVKHLFLKVDHVTLGLIH